MKRFCLLAVAALVLAGSALAATPLGSFATTIKGKGALDGLWVVNFSPTSSSGGGYFLTFKYSPVAVGTFGVKGTTMTFGHESGLAACKGSQANGSYHFTLSGDKKTLKLKAISDTCAGRRTVLTTHPLVLSQ